MRPDLLVVGSGLAGAAAALEAAAAGARVVLAGEGRGASHLAQGGIAAAVGRGDSVALHAEDTLSAGAGACEPRAVTELIGEGPAAIAWLRRQGVPFDGRGGSDLDCELEAAHTRPRIVHVGDRTGAAVMRTLEARLREPGLRVTRMDGLRLIGLYSDGRSCSGGLFQGPAGPVEIRAAATVLATGGFAGLYRRSVSPGTGGGLLAALQAGVELADLEFVQFHPTAYAGAGPSFLVSEAIRGAGARITDLAGRRLLPAVDPRAELAPRSVVARALAEHLRRTGDPFALLDARPLRAELAARFPGFAAACAEVGLDPRSESVPIAPAAHYTMGGIVSDLEGRTSVRGLLAAGECARTGLHGANRLASNSLLEAVVMGRRAARAAHAWTVPPDRAHLVPEAARLGATPPAARLLSRLVGVLRSRRGLEAAAGRLDGLPGLVARAALARTESRGAHHRRDVPDASPEWEGVVLRARLQRDGRVRLVAVRQGSVAIEASA